MIRKPFFSNQSFPFRRMILVISKRPFLYFLSAEVLIGGLWAEGAWGNEFLSRSGAVLALLALGLLWLWLRYGSHYEENKTYVEHMKKLAGKDQQFPSILSKVARAYPQLNDQAKLQISASAYLAVTEGPQLTSDLKRISDSLGYAQIEVAALGTFVWAFGDLLTPFIL